MSATVPLTTVIVLKGQVFAENTLERVELSEVLSVPDREVWIRPPEEAERVAIELEAVNQQLADEIEAMREYLHDFGCLVKLAIARGHAQGCAYFDKKECSCGVQVLRTLTDNGTNSAK